MGLGWHQEQEEEEEEKVKDDIKHLYAIDLPASMTSKPQMVGS